MKHVTILIPAVCISSLLLFGCADKKKIADLDATNQSLQAEIQNLHVQLQAGAADKAKIQELEQANQALQAEIQNLHLQAMNATEASGAKSNKLGSVARLSSPKSKALHPGASAFAKSKGKSVSKASASNAGSTAN